MIIILIILEEEMKKEKKVFEMISRSLLLNIKRAGGGLQDQKYKFFPN